MEPGSVSSEIKEKKTGYSKHFVISRNFPCLIASLLSCLLRFFFFFFVRFLWLGISVEVAVDRIFFVILGRPVRATPNHKMEANSSVQQKDKKADGTPWRLCVSHSSSMGSISEERGRVISGHLAKWFGTNTKLLREVIKPISTPNN